MKDKEYQNYVNELKKIFSSLAINAPYIYSNIDFAHLRDDWIRFFTKNGLPANRLFECYEEVINFKAETNNVFGAVSQLDMLAAWKRVRSKEVSLNSQIKCELCGGTGKYIVFSFSEGKDVEVVCTRQH